MRVHHGDVSSGSSCFYLLFHTHIFDRVAYSDTDVLLALQQLPGVASSQLAAFFACTQYAQPAPNFTMLHLMSIPLAPALVQHRFELVALVRV